MNIFNSEEGFISGLRNTNYIIRFSSNKLQGTKTINGKDVILEQVLFMTDGMSTDHIS